MSDITTSSRLLTLLSLLQARRDWPGPELSSRLGVSDRTVRRDVERLRRLGYPVESLPGPAGGYRLRAGAAMPPLLLDDDEAVAIAVGLRTAARAGVTGIEETAVRALVKLQQVLPPRLRRRVQDLGGALATMAGGGGPTVDPEALTVLAACCRDNERVRFDYRGRDGAATRRDVEPHSMVHLGRRWYLVGWDTRRRDWRTFRVDRLSRPSPAGVRVAPRELPVADPVAYVAQSISAAPSRYEARLVVRAPASEVRGLRAAAWGTITPIDDATCEYRTGDDDLDWLTLRVAMLGVDFEVREPPELVERVAALARRLADAAPRP